MLIHLNKNKKIYIAIDALRTLEWDPVNEQFKNDGVANRLRSKQYREGFGLK